MPGNLHFSFSQLFLGMVFSGVGYIYFVYGKRQGNGIYMIIGAALMAYCYFFSSIVWIVGLGLALSAVPFLFS